MRTEEEIKKRAKLIRDSWINNEFQEYAEQYWKGYFLGLEWALEDDNQ